MYASSLEKKIDKLDLKEAKSYCYNLVSKIKDPCLKGTCRMKKHKKVDSDDFSLPIEPTFGENEKTVMIPMKPPDVPCFAKVEGDDEDPLAPSKTKSQAQREAAGLARLVGIAEGPAAILASFGDADSARESLKSLGAISLGGAFVCECCNCYPCTCGPRGLNIKNIMAALKAMMEGGDELQKLIGALGPGAFEALQALLMNKTAEAAAWAAGAGSTLVVKKPSSDTAMREAWLRGDFDEMRSCHCLPGTCACPGDHYLFKKKEEKASKVAKKKKKARRKVKKIGKDGKEYEEWDWVTVDESEKESRLSDTCICSPTRHYLTPASSESAVTEEEESVKKRRIYWGDLMVCTCPRPQRTLMILKPEVVKFKDVVLRAIQKFGLDVLSERQIQLSPEQASELYSKQYGHISFPNLVVSICRAPVVVLSVAGFNVIKRINNIVGPDGVLPSEWFMPNWITKKYGYFQEIPGALHTSKSYSTSEKENVYFFPNSIIDPVMKHDAAVKDYVDKYINPTLMKGLAVLMKIRPQDPLIFLGEFLLLHNPFQPKFPPNVALTPT